MSEEPTIGFEVSTPENPRMTPTVLPEEIPGRLNSIDVFESSGVDILYLEDRTRALAFEGINSGPVLVHPAGIEKSDEAVVD